MRRIRVKGPKKCFICDTEFYSRSSGFKMVCSFDCQERFWLTPLGQKTLNPDDRGQRRGSHRYIKTLLVDFYRSREWLEARYLTFKTHGRSCLCCGATGKELHVDHIKPRSKFPELSLDLNNLQVLCWECNLGKSNKHVDDWRPNGSTNRDR